MPTELEKKYPQYNIRCNHCGATFLADDVLQIELCRPCFLMGHRGNASGCWKCRKEIETEARNHAD